MKIQVYSVWFATFSWRLVFELEYLHKLNAGVSETLAGDAVGKFHLKTGAGIF